MRTNLCVIFVPPLSPELYNSELGHPGPGGGAGRRRLEAAVAPAGSSQGPSAEREPGPVSGKEGWEPGLLPPPSWAVQALPAGKTFPGN